MINAVAQFIPIVVIYLLLSQYKGCMLFSHTIFGKLLAVFLILFYVSIDKIVGLFVCALLMLFYQMDCVEISLNNEAFNDIKGQTTQEMLEEKRPPPPEYKETKTAKPSNKEDIETFENYNTTYGSDETFKVNETVQNTFRQQNCNKGLLKYKNMAVNNEMASHVFPEVTFKEEHCNVCNPTCKFSIIEAKFKAETKIKREQSP
jgi:hypothetical protein